MKIYTKTGDGGETRLIGGRRVPKDHLRIEACGEVDALNAALSLASSLSPPLTMCPLLQRLQDQLFTVGAVLATPPGTRAAARVPELKPEWVEDMERSIDLLGAGGEAGPPVAPGGSPSWAAALHHARALCRRAERRVVTALHHGEATAQVVTYLNRLSTLLGVLARQPAGAGAADPTP